MKKRKKKVGEGIREMALKAKLKGKNKINNNFLKYMPETEEREIQLMIKSTEDSLVHLGEAVWKLIQENCRPITTKRQGGTFDLHME